MRSRYSLPRGTYFNKMMIDTYDPIIKATIFHDLIQLEEAIEFENDLNGQREILLEKIQRLAYLIIDEG